MIPYDKIVFGPDKSIPGFVAGPAGAKAVIVIQEWWGVTPIIQQHGARIASAGYRVLIPDIYKGTIGADKEEAHHLMSNLDFPAAVAEIGHAAAHLKAEGSPCVGVVGYCMGGALALGGAYASADISCVASFYGINMQLIPEPAKLQKPVALFLGEKDEGKGFSDQDTGRKLCAALEEAGNKNVDLNVYSDVGHAFLNKDPAPFESFDARMAQMGPGFPPYNEEMAARAWKDMFEFFSKNLAT